MSNIKKLIWCCVLIIVAIIILRIEQIGHEHKQDIHSTLTQESELLLPVLSNQGFSQFVNNQTLNKHANKISTSSNDFGIPRDVLIYLQQTIPSNDPQAIYAALRYAQIQENLYTATDEKNAVNYAIEQNIPLSCMVNSLGMDKVSQLTQHLNDIRYSTESGMLQMERIESYLAYKLIGPNLTINQIKLRCQEGNY